ncbi:uncharacterized protein BDZ99DRAFT_153677 [Mytilinidion resinicola]|uniref:2EXR domain-containing protein n=1 Tax=Mytilinidion resinicola TaxID=574789 RepID=A0A6A6Y5S1_9PEZI|nr:uncharacterized protein BDZ99DRAFT_153677 [Mytilinidion resinicola]KAF2804156.1 hypothetical protein BDZ99DRAFT_153677 [Mytilinidion resinicola]
MQTDLRSPAYYDPALYPIGKGRHLPTSWISQALIPQRVPSPPPSTPFRIFDLPTELRLKIFRYVLPHHCVIEIGPRTLKPYLARSPRTPSCMIRMRLTQLPTDLNASRNILAVCKSFRAEAGDILYGENTFRFVVSRDMLGANNIENPFTWVPDGVLSQMRKCEILISEVLERPAVYRRVRRWLERMVQRMGEDYALQRLKVELLKGRLVPWGHAFNMRGGTVQRFRPSARVEGSNGYQFVLEPLARLREVRDVRIQGHVDEGFKGMIQEVMGMERTWDGLNARVYPEKVVLRKKKAGVKKTYQKMSTKKFWQPEYDWGVVGEDEIMSSD